MKLIGIDFLDALCRGVNQRGGHCPAGESCPSTAVPAETAAAPEGWRAWRTDESHTCVLVDVTFTEVGTLRARFPVALFRDATWRRPHGSLRLTSSTLRYTLIVCQYRNTTIALVRKIYQRGQRCEASYVRKASELAALACK